MYGHRRIKVNTHLLAVRRATRAHLRTCNCLLYSYQARYSSQVQNAKASLSWPPHASFVGDHGASRNNAMDTTTTIGGPEAWDRDCNSPLTSKIT